MGAEAWLTLAVVATAVVVLARDMVSAAVVVFAADVALLLLHVVTPAQAFAGFANPAPITVAALFVLARSVEKTGALQPIIDSMLGGRRNGRITLLRLLAPVTAASAFLNNTPIVAMLAPQVADWAEKRGRSASAYLIPLSYATILGGLLTVIGTSTNLVVSGLMEQAGMAPIGMFEVTKVGLPIALVGLAVLVGLAPVLLPERRAARQQFREDVREFVMRTLVEADGPLVGNTVEGGHLRHLQGVFLVEIERGGEVIAPVAPTTVLHGGDRLTFVGRVDLVRDLQNTRGLRYAEEEHALATAGREHTFFEAVISGASPLVGRTLKETDFRKRYQAAVLAIHRAGARVHEKLGQVKLKEGDTLLLLSDREFASRWRDRSDFLLVSHLGGMRPTSSRQAVLVGLVALGVIVVAGAHLLPILHAALLAALVLVIGGALTPAEARDAVEVDVLVVIAASFGVGAGIQSSGLAAVLASGIVGGFGPWGPVGVLLAVTLATIVLTELITNNAAAALLFPIAITTATELGLNPRPYAIAVAMAASASFLTPIGYQTNTMVYGLGGYRFGDFTRLGAPLTLLVVATIVVVIPLFWSLSSS